MEVMKTLILNSELKHIDISNSWYSSKESYSAKYKDNLVLDTREGTIYHESFIDYIKFCYDNHKGLVVSPDMIWHTVLYEISQLIKKDPNTYKEFFTRSGDRIEISVPKKGVLIDIDAILEKLKVLIPSDTKPFLLNFTTTTLNSKLAISTAFCEAVSPYYDYMMFSCGIPEIKILGTKEDWQSIKDSCEKLKNIFTTKRDYFNDIQFLVDKFYKCNDIDFLSKVFSYEREGSGSALFIDGWVKLLFMDKKIRKYSECPQQVSSIEYIDISTNEVFKLYCSVFSSDLENAFLVPKFSYIIKKLK